MAISTYILCILAVSHCLLPACKSANPQVSVLSKACGDFLIGTLDLSNCLSLFSIAEAYGSATLLQSAEGFMIENFHDLSKTHDFLEMQVTPAPPEKHIFLNKEQLVNFCMSDHRRMCWKCVWGLTPWTCPVKRRWWSHSCNGSTMIYGQDTICCPVCCLWPDSITFLLLRCELIHTWDFLKLNHCLLNFSFTSLRSESGRFPPSALWQWVLPGTDLWGSQLADRAQWPAHWRSGSHHPKLHLHPQDRGERRDPPHLLLLFGDRPMERAGHCRERGSRRHARPTGILPDQLRREGTYTEWMIRFGSVNYFTSSGHAVKILDAPLDWIVFFF